MKLRNHLILLVAALVSYNGVCQTIRSGKSSIQIKTEKQEEIVDEQPPSISFVSPLLAEGEILKVTEDELTLIGSVSDESGVKALFINAEPVSLADNNLFASKITLEEGMNTVSLLAIDDLGNHTEAEYEIEYKPEIIFSSPSKFSGVTLTSINAPLTWWAKQIRFVSSFITRPCLSLYLVERCRIPLRISRIRSCESTLQVSKLNFSSSIQTEKSFQPGSFTS